MAQTGYTPISIYNSATTTNVPTAGNLVAGELAINTADGKLFYKDSSGVVQTIATKSSAALGGSTTGTGATVLQTSPTITTPVIDKITTSVANTSLGAGDASIMKNRIINGAMVIDQRNAGASISDGDGAYAVDRFLMYHASGSGSKGNIQQNAGSITPPIGFVNYYGFTSTSAYSVAAGDGYAVQQRIEGYNMADLGWGTANAKTITLSFWAYSSLTGTFGGAIANGGGNYSYPFSYSIPVANTWTQINVTIAGATSGTWLTTNGVGAFVSFSVGTGTTYSGTAGAWTGSFKISATGATSVVGTNGATFYITGVQLEVGSSATGFEYVNYQTSLANCQRYYWKVVPDGGTICGFGSGQFANLTTANIIFNHPVTMRTAPTLAYGGTYNINGGGSAYAVSAVTTYSSSTSGRADFTVSGGIAGYGAAGWLPNASTNFITASAEL